MYLIVGLGNPGPEYRDTRHNIGFSVIDLWSREMGVRLTRRGFQSRNVQTRFQDNKVMLFCPRTFMNLSGGSVRACADYYDLEMEKILVIHDDVDLPVGRIKVVMNGGAGGHKGVLSIINHLGGAHFPRIKIGIGRPRYGEAVEDFVLAPFYANEKKIVEKTTGIAVQACELFVSEGIQSAMNQTNCRDLATVGVKA